MPSDRAFGIPEPAPGLPGGAGMTAVESTNGIHSSGSVAFTD
jgi:hypothetical protein